MRSPDGLARSGAELLREAIKTSYDLFKITVPISIAVRLLQQIGAVDRLGALLAPVMAVVGLPGSMALVWATAMVTNLYGGMVAFAAVAPEASLTVADVTVLTTMMLVAHALPVELRIAQKAGPRLPFMAVLRIAGALAVGWLLHQAYAGTGLLQMPSRALWQPDHHDPSWWFWLKATAKNLGWIFLIILALLLAMKVLQRLGVTAVLCRLLEPVLRLLGMSAQAAPITIIGVTMGLSYGGGLIIQQARSGRMSGRDVFFSLALMGLCHSLIEDTLLMMAMGAHYSGVLLARLAFSLLAIFLLVRLVGLLSDRTFQRLFYRPPRRPGGDGEPKQ